MTKSDRIEKLIEWSKSGRGSKTNSDFIENLLFLRDSGLGTPAAMDDVNDAIKLLLKKAADRKNPAHRKAAVRQRKGWKIQTGSGDGWSDIKVSSGSDFYRNWHFKTKSDAQSELNELARIHGDPESYRIVPAATEQDFDLYNPVHRKNPVRQRIAVSLSRSQARRNPYLESGADISKRSDINRKAASMA